MLTLPVFSFACADVYLTAASEDERTITVTGHGDWWAGVVEDFQEFRERLSGGCS